MTPRFAGRHERYPDLTGQRRAEGGRRLAGEVRAGRPGMPLVTVLTVCFNSAATIGQTIRSVRAQSYPNIEYVVVDGASSDATLDIIRAHETAIDYYVSEPDKGLYYAMNKGIELAQGDYIVILNSDDWFTPDAVAALVAAQGYSGCDFTAGLARYIDEDRGRSEILRPMPFDDSVHFRMPLRHETMLIPAWLYDRVGPYDTDYRIIADRDLTARLFEAGATFYEVPRALLNFRITGVSNTNLALLEREKDMLLARDFPFLTPEERQRLNDPAQAGPEGFAEIANAHLDQPKFVRAARALLDDRRANGGRRWQSDAIDTIGAGHPDWPEVSVILPFYEAADSIAACLDSILAQSLGDLEILCVNDCAIDDSQAVVDARAGRDARVKRLRNPRNLGLGASRNAGIRAARGRYIFHVDPDDTIPPDALEKLVATARAHGSDMVKGAYKAGQGLHRQKAETAQVKYPCGVRNRVVPNTTLSHTPRLLRTTEGHWSYLYDAQFARRVPYPTDLKMGQDSIFLVNAVARARGITLLPEVVYHYEANPNSAMNRFTARKFMDGLEWRRRAWHVLSDADRRRTGEFLLFAFWSEAFFDGVDTLPPAERQIFHHRFREVLRAAGYPGSIAIENLGLKARIEAILGPRDLTRPLPAGADPGAALGPGGQPLRIATFSTQDHGGAGLGSQRRVEALRARGVDAHIHCVFRKTDKDHVHQVPTLSGDAPEADQREAWRAAAVLTRAEHPQLKAREMFSKPGSVVDFRRLGDTFDAADVVHMHWVSGMFDFDHAPEMLGDRPVVWTLADMNAFTGGCHYSEGCTNFRNDCRGCPLLAPGSEIAHEGWKKKRAAYAGIPNLHVICPSQWLADCARDSSLLGDRPVHMIPNAFPVDRFQPGNKIVAREKLGLPLDRKLVVFGADSLNNRRKGGDILQAAVARLKAQGRAEGVEGLFFGSSTLDLGIPAHNMGHVSDERKLSLIYAAADVFAFPSREDNAPLTVVESMLSGTPVVGFPVGNVPELIAHCDTGYIATYGDAEDFAAGLDWALRDPGTIEARLRGLRNALKARAHNDPGTAVARHLELYRRITAGTGATPSADPVSSAGAGA